jgi:hypothetical protein
LRICGVEKGLNLNVHAKTLRDRISSSNNRKKGIIRSYLPETVNAHSFGLKKHGEEGAEESRMQRMQYQAWRDRRFGSLGKPYRGWDCGWDCVSSASKSPSSRFTVVFGREIVGIKDGFEQHQTRFHPQSHVKGCEAE